MSQGPVWPVTRPCAARRSRVLGPGGLTSSLQGLPSPCDAPIPKFDSFCRKEQNRNLLCPARRPARYGNVWEHMRTMADAKKVRLQSQLTGQPQITLHRLCVFAQLLPKFARLVLPSRSARVRNRQTLEQRLWSDRRLRLRGINHDLELLPIRAGIAAKPS